MIYVLFRGKHTVGVIVFHKHIFKFSKSFVTIRRVLKNNVDFQCVKLWKYDNNSLSSVYLITEKISSIQHEFMGSYPLLKWPTIADPAHVSDVMSILRFIQVTKPIISSRIIRFQAEHAHYRVAVFMFILNISIEQTKFKSNGGSISSRNLTITLAMDIYDNGQFTKPLTYTSSDIHGIRKIICAPIHKDRYTYLAFSIANWMLPRCLRRNSEVFTAVYDFHMSNNDAIHGIPGYFKCR